MRVVSRFCLLTTILFYAGAAAGQSARPDRLTAIGGTYFAYYQGEDKTVAMSKPITVFDNSAQGFRYVHGVQRVELFLTYEFKGKVMTAEPSAVTLAFESRSSAERLNGEAARAFLLTADDGVITRATARLTKTKLIGLVTWQNMEVSLPVSDVEKFLAAKQKATLTLGSFTHTFTAGEFAMFRDFIDALRQARKASQ